MDTHSSEEREAASFVVSLRKHDLGANTLQQEHEVKRARTESFVPPAEDEYAPIPINFSQAIVQNPQPPPQLAEQHHQPEQQQQTEQHQPQPIPFDPTSDGLKPAPFFHYKDYSTQPDPDPLTPVTMPGRVPNFPAKMHAILSRPDLADICCWLHHGRSWKILRPREFEIRVIPKYFDHAKFSSFIRQANGWGFRRITCGHDRNSYYHPMFLRGLPHLCKQMKRPGVSEKAAIDPDQEPDLAKISELFPVPMKADDDSIMLPCVVKGGPKARVPITSILSTYTPTSLDNRFTPRDQEELNAFQKSLGVSDGSSKMQISPAPTKPRHVAQMAGQPSLMMPAFQPQQQQNQQHSKMATTLATANQMAFPAAAALEASSQFAAGFAVAAAMTQQQFQSMMGSFAQQQPFAFPQQQQASLEQSAPQHHQQQQQQQ